MGHQKKKNTKKRLDFFTVNCRFTQPYKVLLDGNFIHTALGLKMTDIEKRFNDLLGATKGLKLHVTPCILYELTMLGPEYIETLKWASTHARLVQCSHEHDHVEPDICINSLIGMDNPDQYHVATQDKQLRGSVGRVKAGPTLYISVNGFHLSRPSETQRQLAGQVAVANMQPSELELGTDVMRQLPGLHSSLQTSARFKKKKAKGPNPLAVKAPKAAKKAKRPRTTALERAAATAEAGATAAVERPQPQPEQEPSEEAAMDGAAPAESRLAKTKRLLEKAQDSAEAAERRLRKKQRLQIRAQQLAGADPQLAAGGPEQLAQQGSDGNGNTARLLGLTAHRLHRRLHWKQAITQAAAAAAAADADARADAAAEELPQPIEKRVKPGRNLPKKSKEEKKRKLHERRARQLKKRKAKKKRNGRYAA